MDRDNRLLLLGASLGVAATIFALVLGVIIFQTAGPSFAEQKAVVEAEVAQAQCVIDTHVQQTGTSPDDPLVKSLQQLVIDARFHVPGGDIYVSGDEDALKAASKLASQVIVRLGPKEGC